MKKQYTYQDLETFFDQFKRTPEYISLEQVTQIVQHPSPAFTLPTKGATIKLWSTLLTTAALITTASILYFSSSNTKDNLGEMTPVKKEILPPLATIPAMTADTIKMEIQEAPEQKTKQLAVENEVASVDINESNQQVFTQKPKKNQNQEMVAGSVDENSYTIEEPIDGNPYIIDDLSMEELRKLGFDIQHYSVFYRNTMPGVNCLFISWFRDDIWYSKSKEEMKTKGNKIQELDILLRDTLPNEIHFFASIKSKQFIPGQNSKPELYHFKSTNKDYYPVYVSSLDGEITGIHSINEFEQVIDTLVPIILPFSRLNCTQKKDLIFWFSATKDFYNDIPERYNHLQSFISNIKRNKEINPDVRLVNYDIETWISNRVFPPDRVIDGTGFNIELTRDEQERIGLFREKDNETSYEGYYLTPWGQGLGMGGNWTWVKTPNLRGKDSIQFIVYDNVYNVDFLPSYRTDTLGISLRLSTTGKNIQSSLIENDLLIPIRDSETIHWFTQSDYLWTLLPERYRHLQEIYQKIFFTKSLYPDIDLVRYFPKEREHLDMNVEILDLSQSELENLGFHFIKDSLAFQSSVYNKEWVQLHFFLLGDALKMSEKYRERILEIGLRGSIDVVNESNKDWKKENTTHDYDELIKTPFQDFQFVTVTDETGLELLKFRSVARDEYLKGKESQYLIPVRVPLDKYFSEYSETKIFWFTPTEAFFDRLPDRISKELRQDFYSLTGDLKESSCTYFEECKSTLTLDNFKIFPNPASDRITISFNTDQEVNGKIYLLDIRGGIVKTFESDALVRSGENDFTFQLDGVLPGIYLVAIHSDAGIKTGRLIVTE